MKELIVMPIVFALCFGFLVGFSSKGSSYIQERQDYYETLATSAPDEQTRAVYRLASTEVFHIPPEKGRTQPGLRSCLGGKYPRMTRMSWMGATQEENRQWHVRNERACLDQMKTRFRADGNEVGLIALEKISLPQA